MSFKTGVLSKGIVCFLCPMSTSVAVMSDYTLPTETYTEILQPLPFSALWNAGLASRKLQSIRDKVLDWRWRALLSPYVPDVRDMQHFGNAMVDAEAGIVGSSALWFSEPKDAMPPNLNFAVPRGRAAIILEFFQARRSVNRNLSRLSKIDIFVIGGTPSMRRVLILTPELPIPHTDSSPPMTILTWR